MFILKVHFFSWTKTINRDLTYWKVSKTKHKRSYWQSGSTISDQKMAFCTPRKKLLIQIFPSNIWWAAVTAFHVRSILFWDIFSRCLSVQYLRLGRPHVQIIVIIKTSKYRIMFKPIWSNLIKSIVGRWFWHLIELFLA